MVTFFSVIIYFAVITISVLLIIQIRKLSQALKKQTEQINELDKNLYSNLRMAQFKAMDISRQADKYIKGKNSILSEIISTVALAILPFKKLKSLIYLHKLGKKVMR